jgi:hypothetical protein
MADSPLTEVARRAFNDREFFERLQADRDGALLEGGLQLSATDRRRLDAALSGTAVVARFDFVSWVTAIHYPSGDAKSARLPGPRWPGQEWEEMLFGGPRVPSPRAPRARATGVAAARKRSKGGRKARSAAKGRSSSRRKK